MLSPRWLTCWVVLASQLVACSPPRHPFYGQYRSCPWPGLSGFRLILSASGASLSGFGDAGGWSTDLSGDFTVRGEEVVISFSAGDRRATPDAPPEPAEPQIWRLGYRRLEGAMVLGPLTEVSYPARAGKESASHLFFARAAGLADSVPDAYQCPAEVDALVSRSMSMEHHKRPEGLPPANGYSHAVAFSGRMVVISGQVPVDESGAIVGRGDPRAQIRQVFANVERALAAAGARLEHVVKLNVYLTDPADLDAFRAIRNEHLSAERPPASTLVLVKGLVHPEFRVEIDALAAL